MDELDEIEAPAAALEDPDFGAEPLEELQPEPLESGDALLEVKEPEPAQPPEEPSAQSAEEELEEASSPTMLIGGNSPEPAEEEPPAPTAVADAASDDASERGFDRQELVRTMQMQAVDRDEIDLAIELERLDNAEIVETQRFAPD